jgi:AcrR family transcriptional regulator
VPTPERTTIDQIVLAGRELLEQGGLTSLTMQAVATRVGVRAPSLYKRVRDRDALVTLVAEASIDDLRERLVAAVGDSGDPGEALIRLARALRVFAHERPAAFALTFGSGPAGVVVKPESYRRASAPVLDVAARLAGDRTALDAARLITAWANGFIMMELTGAFQLGGDVDRAFEWGVQRLVEAIRS